MFRRSSLLALLLVCGSFATSAFGQVFRSPLITPDTARRHGLERAWATQVQMDRTKDRIQDIVLYQKQLLPGPAAPATGAPLRIGGEPPAADPFQQNPPANNDSNPFNNGGNAGNPFGQNEDEDEQDENPFGNAPNDQGAGANPFGNAPANEPAPQPGIPAGEPPAGPGGAASTSVAEPGTLVVQTVRGVLQAFDAETGRTLWVIQAGDRMQPREAPAVSEKHVAVIYGLNLMLIERANGRIVWERRLTNVAISGPTLTDEFVYTVSVGGQLTAYDVRDPSKSWGYTSFGRVESPVTIGRKSVAWATDRGYAYISWINEHNVLGRFETGKSVTAPVTYWPPLFFVAAQNGYVYALDEMKGTAAWQFSLGEVLRQPPVAVGDSVYAIPETGGMLALSTQQGIEQWFAPQVEKFVSASPHRLYVVDGQRRLLVLDRQSGAPVTSLPLGVLDMQFTNTKNDRIYLATSTGNLQCLREIELKHPAVHTWPAEKKRATQAANPLGGSGP